MQLSLWTVQFWLKYWINNKIWKPTLEQSIEMLKFAYDNWIDTFDTASAYWNAEEVLWIFVKKYDLKNEVFITSKLKPNIFDDFVWNKSEKIEEEIIKSLEILNIDKLDWYLLHSPKYIFNNEILVGLENVKIKWLINNYWVSIYEPEEALYAVNNTNVSYIQIPYNIFDQRLDKTDFFKTAKEKDIKIYARTSFIQWLIFMSDNEIPNNISESKKYFFNFDNIIKKYNFSRLESAINFTKYHKYIDYLVFWVDSLNQLHRNIDIFTKNIDFNKCHIDLKSKFSDLDTIIFFPSLWNKK